MKSSERIEEQRRAVTMEECKAAVIARGYRVSSGCWEDESHVYAFSVEIEGPATLGHPKCTAHFSKSTGWFTVQ